MLIHREVCLRARSSDRNEQPPTTHGARAYSKLGLTADNADGGGKHSNRGRTVRVSKGLREGGVVVGNLYDKYHSRNPLVHCAMHRFEVALSDFVAKAAPRTIHEVGCGEGYWALRWSREGLAVRGTDVSHGVIQLARENAAELGLDPDIFAVRSIYDLQPSEDSADLIVCCEVLEHLEFPDRALRSLRRMASKYLILSVPREPVFRVLNIARGSYLSKWGSTPGHIQHWSRRSFIQLVERSFEIVAVRLPIPWTMVLCRMRNQ